MNHRLLPSAWEDTPLLLRWKGRYRRRVTKWIFLFGIAIDHKRTWEYADAEG